MELGLYLKHGSKGRQFWVAAAGSKTVERFVVCADEKVTALLELESALAEA
jgi:hypothetical protein